MTPEGLVKVPDLQVLADPTKTRLKQEPAEGLELISRSPSFSAVSGGPDWIAIWTASASAAPPSCHL